METAYRALGLRQTCIVGMADARLMLTKFHMNVLTEINTSIPIQTVFAD